MTRTVLKRAIVTISGTAALVFASGCNEAVTDTSAETDIGQTSAPVVAKVSLSDTHTLSFLDLGDGEVGVLETFDAQKDASAALELSDMKPDGMNAVAVYQRVAGAKQDPQVLEKLRTLDQLAIERIRAVGAAGGAELAQPLADGALEDDASTGVSSIDPTSLPEVAQKKQALCSEPSWDWDADHAWFRDNFCGPNPIRCQSLVASTSGGYHRGPGWFKVTGFAQSHCGNAKWIVKKKTWAGFPTYAITEGNVVNTTIDARYLSTFWRVNISEDHAYRAEISAQNGAVFVGIAYEHE